MGLEHQRAFGANAAGAAQPTLITLAGEALPVAIAAIGAVHARNAR
jgi:hypothetical protein